MYIGNVKAGEPIYIYGRIESIIDQISTLASRVAILAHHEIRREYSEVEKDDPQVLEVVTKQAYKIAKDASQAAEYAAQAARRAGQSVTQLIHDLEGPSQIGNLATQARTWLLLPSKAKTNVKNSYSPTEIRSSIYEAELMCWKADTACKAAGNVYEKIEQARRDAEQFCKKGIIAAEPISWRPVWPWSFPRRAASSLFKQSEEATKQSSEAVDQVGQAAVLAGQAVAQSGQAVAQASQAVAVLGQLVTRCDSYWPLPLRKLRKETILLNRIIPVAQHVGVSVARASQLAAQASQAANNVALAAQTAQKTARIAQAGQQIEWLKKKRQKWILGLGMILSLASICLLLLAPIMNPNNYPAFHLIITTIGIAAIVDSYFLLTSLGENIQKMTRLSHKLLTLICCALLFLLPGFVIYYALLPWILPYPPTEMPRAIPFILTILFIILPPFITGIVYSQHRTLNNLHPYEAPTSALES